MFEFGSFSASSCSGMTRRALLSTAVSVPAAWGLGSLLNAAAPVGPGKAKSVIMVWLWGGPSQNDTFDPKPNASSSVRSPFQPIATRAPGVQFTEILPRLAARSDRFAVVRSSYLNNGHDTRVLTGVGKGIDKKAQAKGNGSDPNFGAIVSQGKRTAGLPPFIAVTPRTTLSHGVNADTEKALTPGKFGAAASPFFIRCSTRGELDVASLKLIQGLTLDRLNDRRSLRNELESLRRKMDDAPLGKYDPHFEGAYDLLAGPGAIKAFDLSAEKDKTRAAYGKTYFGQGMLLARRLVQAGVPYVHVNWSQGVDSLEEGPRMGWDLHRNLFGQMIDYHGPIFDRAMSALIDDLHDRGLLDSTLVVAFGEMGRTPKINGSGGRDHWHTASTLWAGGGVVGGRIVGATDKDGGEPTTDPKTAASIGATICEAVGINAQQRAQMGVLGNGEVIRELFA